MMQLDRSKLLFLLVILVSSSVFFTSCLDVLVQVALYSIMSHQDAKDDPSLMSQPPSPRKRPPLSPTEQFYLQADRTDHYLPGMRIITNFDCYDGSYPQVNRIEMSWRSWYQMFYSKSPKTNELKNIFRELDGKKVTITLINESLLTPDLKGNFIFDDFLRLNNDLATTVSDVTIFEDNLITYYSKTTKNLYVLLLPSFPFTRLIRIIQDIKDVSSSIDN